MLSEDELMRISALVKLEIAVHKNVLSYTSDPDSKVFFIKSGHVKIVQEHDGDNELITDVLGPGEFFGPIVTALGGNASKRSEYASVIDEATICVFDRSDFERVLQEMPALQVHVLAFVSERAERVSERLADMVFRTARERIKGFLTRTGERFGEVRDGETHIAIQLTHAEIALLTGTSRQTVASVLTELRREGFATVTQNMIIIH